MHAHDAAPDADLMINEIDALADRLMGRAVCIASDIPVDVRCDILLAIVCLRTLARSVPADTCGPDLHVTVPAKITTGAAALLANRLTCEQATPTDRATAGRLIQALLKQCHKSDFWTLPPESSPRRNEG